MTSTEDYNSEPVFYCRECLSLAIMNAGGHDYCRACGSTDIAWAPIERWEWLYRNKYNEKLIDDSKRRKRK